MQTPRVRHTELPKDSIILGGQMYTLQHWQAVPGFRYIKQLLAGCIGKQTVEEIVQAWDMDLLLEMTVSGLNAPREKIVALSFTDFIDAVIEVLRFNLKTLDHLIATPALEHVKTIIALPLPVTAKKTNGAA